MIDSGLSAELKHVSNCEENFISLELFGSCHFFMLRDEPMQNFLVSVLLGDEVKGNSGPLSEEDFGIFSEEVSIRRELS